MDPELQRVFNAAVASGINVFDTADSYGTGSGLDGRSEVLLGKFLRECKESSSAAEVEAASQVQIATKFAAYPWRITPGKERVREHSVPVQYSSIHILYRYTEKRESHTTHSSYIPYKALHTFRSRYCENPSESATASLTQSSTQPDCVFF